MLHIAQYANIHTILLCLLVNPWRHVSLIQGFSPLSKRSTFPPFIRCNRSLITKSLSLLSSASPKEPPSELSTDSSSTESFYFDYNTPLPESKYTQILSMISNNNNGKQDKTEKTSSVAPKLRNYFDEMYMDPRAPDNRRFTWDPWFVRCSEGKNGGLAPLPGDDEYEEEEDNDIDYNINLVQGEREAVGKQIQYSLKRVQASTFFSVPYQSENKQEFLKHDIDNQQDMTTSNKSEQNSNNDKNSNTILDHPPPTLYDEFIEEITTLGRSIGLVSTTPPWLSLYTHNDFQNFHTDATHGPMAWVYPLPSPQCQENPTYEGGDTMLLHPSILTYWKTFAISSSGSNGSSRSSSTSGKETPSIVRYIPSTTLGKCIAFDPRVPHGVSQVKMISPNDIRHGRLVLHGWFADPQVVWKNFHDTTTTATTEEEEEDDDDNDLNVTILNNVLTPLIQTLGEGDIGRVMGYLAVKLQILPDGSVGDVDAVCDTMVSDPNDFRGVIGYDEEDRPVYEDACADVKLTIYEALKGIYFSPIDEDEDDMEEELEEDEEDVQEGDDFDDSDRNQINVMREVIIPFAFE